MDIYPLPPFTQRDRREQKRRVKALFTDLKKEEHRRKMDERNEKLRQFCVMLEKAYKATANSTLRFA